MTRANTADLVSAAVEAGKGLAAFNIIHLETAEGLVMAAEAARVGIILQLSENCVRFHGSLKPMALACLALIDSAEVPIALHLDHAESEELIFEALDLGFSSVMYDGSKLPYDQNVAATRRVVEHAHALGRFVEAELGEIGGKDGAHTFGARTDPTEALEFVAATGVDALAVAVGTSHAMTSRHAKVDAELIRKLRMAVPVPLVLHGSSGLSDAELSNAIAAGMTKINVSTLLNYTFTTAIREFLTANPQAVDSREYMKSARSALQSEATGLIKLLSKSVR